MQTPHHILSLPTETLQGIISALDHPIDLHNLALTCKLFHAHLTTSLSNRVWHNLLKSSRAASAAATEAYNPDTNYHMQVKTHLTVDGCHFCLAQDTYAAQQQRRRMKIQDGPSGNRHFGPRICNQCLKDYTIANATFKPFKLDITTNPPKFSDHVANFSFGRRTVRYYWKPDIDALCVAQKGYTLDALIQQKERARAETIARGGGVAPVGWVRTKRNAVKARLSDAAWAAWIADDDMAHARATFAAGLTREGLGRLLGLLEAQEVDALPPFVKVQFKAAKKKAAYDAMDQAWVGDVAGRMVGWLKGGSEVYRDMCFDWHVERIREGLVHTGGEAAADFSDVCPISQGTFGPPGVLGLVQHVRDCHEVEFWERSDWSMA